MSILNQLNVNLSQLQQPRGGKAPALTDKNRRPSGHEARLFRTGKDGGTPPPPAGKSSQR